jgi:hypothetical protein
MQRTIDNAQLRGFGFIVAGGFTVIALWPVVLRAEAPRMWALVPALVLFLMALVVPPALRPFYRAWMTVGEALGWVNSRIILGVIYYGLIVPIGAVRRTSGHDPMRRAFDPDAATYRTRREKRPASHMMRQY